MKLVVKLLINTSIGVVLILIWLQFVDIGQIAKVLKTAKPTPLFFALLFVAIASVLRTVRLKLLLSQYNLPLRELIPLQFVSQFLSFFIPIRAGEIAKSIYLSSQFSLPLGKSIVWILIDRFLDFWVNLLLVGTLILFVSTNLPVNFKYILFSILAVFTTLAMVAVLSSKFAHKLIDILNKILIFPKLRQIFITTSSTIIEGFEVLRRDPSELFIIVLLTILAAIGDSMIWFFALRAINVDLEFLKIVLGNLLSALTFMIPAAPGYVGSAEAAGLAVFGGILGLDPTIASAGTVLTHILSALALLIFGIASLYFLKFDLNLVWRKILRK